MSKKDGGKLPGAQDLRLPREFFVRDGLTVAKELLGKMLVHRTSRGIVRGIVTEVEAYMGEEDKGSHTYGGRRTERTEPMYHVGGTSYVYLIYGMYSCMNVSCKEEGISQAVLLRSVVPADEASKELMQELRLEDMRSRQSKRRQQIPENAKSCNLQQTNASPIGAALPTSIKKHLADGPGKLCIAMGISRADNDIDMVESEDFYFAEGIFVEQEQIRAGKRIGIDYAREAAEYLWRFYLEEGAAE